MIELVIYTENKEAKLLAFMLEKMGYEYTKYTIPEEDDPILLTEAEHVKNEKPLGEKTKKEIDDYIDAQIQANV